MEAQVFISYAREDRAQAQALAQALEAAGLATWWDRELVVGDDFAAEIERQLAQVRVAVVLWSASSVASGFVRDESQRARDGGKLLPVRIADVPLPLGFGTLHTLDLLDWDGGADDPACRDLVNQVAARVRGQTPMPTPLPRPGGAPLAGRRALVATVGAVVAGGIGAGGFGGWRWLQQREAQRLFEAGQAAQFARDPAYEVARDRYREALQRQPRLALAHYHLATVYLRLYAEAGSTDALLLTEAAQHFRSALEGGAALDRSQMQDARQQVALLSQADADAPVTRSASTSTAATPRPPSASSPPRVTLAKRPTVVAAGPIDDAPTAAAASAGPTPAAAPQTTRPPDAALREAGPLARRAFDADRAQRSAAANELALRPALAGVALDTLLPLARQAARAEADAAARDGLLATLAVLQSASPATLRQHREAAQALAQAARTLGEAAATAAGRVDQALAPARVARPPRVYVQLAREDQRPVAERLAERMRVAGYQVPAFEVVGAKAPDATELRSQGGSHLGLARWCADLTRTTTGAAVATTTLRQARPDTDTFELWLGRSLGAAGG